MSQDTENQNREVFFDDIEKAASGVRLIKITAYVPKNADHVLIIRKPFCVPVIESIMHIGDKQFAREDLGKVVVENSDVLNPVVTAIDVEESEKEAIERVLSFMRGAELRESLVKAKAKLSSENLEKVIKAHVEILRQENSARRARLNFVYKTLEGLKHVVEDAEDVELRSKGRSA